jgi:hypothetical protein
MRIIAFINEGLVIREKFSVTWVSRARPRLAPARGPPLWELPASEQAEREIDPLAQPRAGLRFDQRVAW